MVFNGNMRSLGLCVPGSNPGTLTIAGWGSPEFPPALDAGDRWFKSSSRYKHNDKECEMKFGYLRSDDDGHNYVVPEELIEEFDADQQALEETESEDDYYRLINAWNDKWGAYNEGGSVSHYKVVMEE